MKTRILAARRPQYLLLAAALLLFAGGVALAQVPVDEDGNPIGSSAPVTDAGDAAPVLSGGELEALVGPIALYPDDLLAIVLPASTYPLEIVQAARFLDDLENDSSLQPDESWDESIVALLNYPEVVRMMNDDIDWTWQLGEAVVAQQTDVVAAVEAFRDRAYAAGNLKSDEYQTVNTENEVIQIEPVSDDVIYVPYYEPEQVVVYQPRRVYYYYPRAYPVYYYPYPVGYNFGYDHFWGVTTAFSIGWTSHHLRVYHHSFHGHPYFGHQYYGNYWRQPSINIFNNYYGNYGYSSLQDRYRYGSYWRPRYYGGARPGHYEARSRYYSNRRSSSSSDGYADDRDDRDSRDSRQSGAVNPRAGLTTNRRDIGASAERRSRDNAPVRLRSRDGAASATGERRAVNSSAPANAASRQRDSADSATVRRTPATVRQNARNTGSDRAIRFRERNNNANNAAAQSRQATGTARQAPATVERRASPSRPSTARTAPTERRSAPNTDRRATSAPRTAPQPARRSAPTVQRSTPSVRRSAPQVQRSAPAAQRAAPTVRQSSPQVQRSAPATQSRAPQVQRSAPSVRRSAPTTRNAAPAPRRQSSSSAGRSTSQDRSSRRNRD
ncbi:MAG: DUF3300 domain-containing protein [Woeseia sp.]